MLSEKYGLLEEDHVLAFEDFLRGNSTGIVLDIGCAYRNPKGNKAELVDHLVGIDIGKMITAALLEEDLPDNFSFVRGDATQMPFRNNSIDTGLLVGIFNPLCLDPEVIARISPSKASPEEEYKIWCKMLPEFQEALLKETYRVLKPDAGILVTNGIKSHEESQTIISKFAEYFSIEQVYVGEERHMFTASIKV